MVELKKPSTSSQGRTLVSMPEKGGKSANAKKKEKKKLRDQMAKQDAEERELSKLLKKGNEEDLKERNLKRKKLPARKTVVDELGEEWE